MVDRNLAKSPRLCLAFSAVKALWRNDSIRQRRRPIDDLFTLAEARRSVREKKNFRDEKWLMTPHSTPIKSGIVTQKQATANRRARDRCLTFETTQTCYPGQTRLPTALSYYHDHVRWSTCYTLAPNFEHLASGDIYGSPEYELTCVSYCHLDFPAYLCVKRGQPVFPVEENILQELTVSTKQLVVIFQDICFTRLTTSICSPWRVRIITIFQTSHNLLLWMFVAVFLWDWTGQ